MADLYSDLQQLTRLRFHVKRRHLARQQKLIAQKGGVHQAVRKGRGMTFNEVRAYQPGDDVRHIDWKVTARQQKAHTKVFTEELEKPVVLVCELSPILFFGTQVRFKTVQALNLAAALGWATLHQGDRVGGWAFNAQQHFWVSPKHQHKALMQWLHGAQSLEHQLTQPGLQSPNLWPQQMDAMSPYLRPGSRLILIGHLLDQTPEFFTRLRSLKKHHQIDLLHLYDPLEQQLPHSGTLRLTDGHQQAKLNTQNQKTLNAWQSGYHQAWSQLETQAQTLHLPLLAFDSQQDPVTALTQAGMLQ